MRPRRTPVSNVVFGLEGGTEDNDLWAYRHTDIDGTPTISSVWSLDADERALVAAGANIQLTVWGNGTPPVALRVTSETVGR